MSARWFWLAVAYAAVIAYGSLFPFTGWHGESSAAFAFLTHAPDNYPRADILSNVLAYVPLGLLLSRAWGGAGLAAAVALAALAGGALSFSMEALQQFMPGRVSSVLDLVTNMSGAAAGALVGGFARADRLPGRFVSRWRVAWIKRGRTFDLGLVVLGTWALSQWMPLVPSLDVGNLRNGIAPLGRAESFGIIAFASYALSFAGLALLAKTMGAPGRPIVRMFFAFAAVVLVYKIPVVGRQLSLEALAGALAALAVAPLFLALRARVIACVGAVLILGGFACAQLSPGAAGVPHPFNWVPFGGHMQNPLTGVAAILEVLWPAGALAYLVRFAAAKARRTAIAWTGAIALALIAFGLEWYQQFVPGRYGDLTTVLLMVGAWGLCWLVPPEEQHGPAIGRTTPAFAAAAVPGAAARVARDDNIVEFEAGIYQKRSRPGTK